MNEFLSGQLDYVYFAQGLAFVLVAEACRQGARIVRLTQELALLRLEMEQLRSARGPSQ